jgi:hypothetical protein
LNTLDEFSQILHIAVSSLAESLPIFHRPTLNFEFLHRELTASIFCFGLLVSDQPDFHEIGCSLLHRLRGDIILVPYSSLFDGFKLTLGSFLIITRSKRNKFGFYRQCNISYCSLYVCLQIHHRLVLEFGGMFYANRKAMELSDIFHGTMVTLARRLGIFEPSYEPARPSSSLSADSRWLEWIHKESLKRYVVVMNHKMD